MTQLPAHVQEYIDSIGTVDYFSRRGPLPEGCKLYKTRDAAWAAAKGAAWDAEWDAALDAAWAAAWDAAGDAAWDAAWDAARTAARDAEWDAALLAICLLTHKHIDPKHLAYALMRWAIWQAGYGVAAEVDGTHYCYRRP